MWNLYPFLHANSGLTPPYANFPAGSGDAFFTPPWVKPTGGTALVPFQERFPALKPNGQLAVPETPGLPAVSGGSNLPAIRSPSALTKASGGLSGLLDFLRPVAGAAAKNGAARLLGGPLTGLLTAAQVMQPTPMGAEPPLYVRDASGKMVPNTANPAVVRMLQHGFPSVQTSNAPMPVAPAVAPPPLPMADPRSSVPLPRRRPAHSAGAPLSLAPPAPLAGNPFYNGPGSESFGSEGPSGNAFGQGPGLLSFLFRK